MNGTKPLRNIQIIFNNPPGYVGNGNRIYVTTQDHTVRISDGGSITQIAYDDIDAVISALQMVKDNG